MTKTPRTRKVHVPPHPQIEAEQKPKRPYRRKPKVEQPAPTQDAERDPLEPEQLTDAERVTLLSALLSEARTQHFILLQKFAAVRVLHEGIGWGQAQQDLDSRGQQFDHHMAALEERLEGQMLASRGAECKRVKEGVA